jgi:hypothetical protein
MNRTLTHFGIPTPHTRTGIPHDDAGGLTSVVGYLCLQDSRLGTILMHMAMLSVEPDTVVALVNTLIKPQPPVERDVVAEVVGLHKAMWEKSSGFPQWSVAKTAHQWVGDDQRLHDSLVRWMRTYGNRCQGVCSVELHKAITGESKCVQVL